jgi:hypothetical protein
MTFCEFVTENHATGKQFFPIGNDCFAGCDVGIKQAEDQPSERQRGQDHVKIKMAPEGQISPLSTAGCYLYVS